MKKFILCALVAIGALQIATAQSKGDRYFGGNIGIAVASADSYTETTFQIAPEVGLFVANNLRVGGKIGYNLTAAEGLSSHTLTIGPNIAYYARLCDRLYYTPEFGIGFAYSSADGYGFSGVYFDLKLGALEFKATERCGIAVNLISLEYCHLSNDGVGANAVGFNLGINPTIGFRIYF